MSRHRTVADVMTIDVVTVEPTAPFKEIVRTMDGFGVSGLPVVGLDDRPVGVVTQADLLVKEAHLETRPHHPLFELHTHKVERRKAAGQVATDLMSCPAITISADASLVEAARLMARTRINRLLVTDDNGRLTGIVSREDMLEVFLRPDAEIRDEIVHDVIHGDWMMDPSRFDVAVREGVVSLQGRVERRSHVPALAAAVGAVDGVIGVDTRLTWDEDDLAEYPLATLGI
jgi:CBS domain-containing protein